jgi:hypothetical protein
MAASPNIVSTGSPMRFTQSEATAAQATWSFYLSNAADGTPATGKTLATTDFKISKAGGAFGNAAGTITEMSLGWYKIVFSAADLDTLGCLACELSGEAGVDTLHVSHQVVADDQYTGAAGIADAVWDEAASGHVAAGSFGLQAQIVKSLAGGNVVIDGGAADVDGPTYDTAGMLTAGRLRVFDTGAHALAATAGGAAETGTLAVFTIGASGANGRMSLYRTSED